MQTEISLWVRVGYFLKRISKNLGLVLLKLSLKLKLYISLLH